MRTYILDLDAHRNSKAVFRCPSRFEMECTWLQTRSELYCGYTQTCFCSKEITYKPRLAKEQKKWPRVVEKFARGHTKPVPEWRTASRSPAPTSGPRQPNHIQRLPKMQPNQTTDLGSTCVSVCLKQTKRR